MRIEINGKHYNFTGIKKAVGDAQHSMQYYRTYCDYSDNTVWTNTYNSGNSWSVYHDSNIIQIASGNGSYSIFGLDNITMEELKKKIIENYNMWVYCNQIKQRGAY